MGQREEIIKRHSESVQDVAELLYGDGAWEIIKRLTPQEHRERTQARIGWASNVLGLTAGVVGTKQAYTELQQARNKTKYVGRHFATPQAVKGLKGSLKAKGVKYALPLAGGALGLQVANNFGDVVANRVLAREAQGPDRIRNAKVRKAAEEGISSDLNPRRIKGRLVKAAVHEGIQDAPVVAKGTKAGAIKIKDAVKKDLDITWAGEISKMDTDKRQVFGWASIIEMDGKPVVDLQGDMMTLEVIEKAAYDYVKSSRKGGNQHARDDAGPKQVSDMIESFLVTEDKKQQMGLPDGTPTGWWVGFQINDDETWQQVKSGERKEFSIHGSGVRKELEIED